MKYFESLKITQRWKSHIEACGDLRLNFINVGKINQAENLPSHICSKNNCKNCLKYITSLSQKLTWETYYHPPCPFGLNLSLVPIHNGVSLASLVSVVSEDISLADNKISDSFNKLIFDIFNYLYYCECPTSAFSISDSAEHSKKVLKKICQHINMDFYQSSISLKTVAKEFNISYFHLSHLFKKHIGISFIRYLTKIRIDKSIKFLRNKKLSISQVAYAVGCTDPGYFCKVFKQSTKISPGAYRQRLSFSQSKLGYGPLTQAAKKNIPKRKAHLLVGD